MRGGEDAGVSRHAAEAVRVLVVHAAPDDAAAGGRLVLLGGDAWLERGRWVVHRLGHSERLRDVLRDHAVERSVR